MTVIAGVVDGGKVWMGCDSLGSNGWLHAWNLRDKKIFTVGPFLVGTCGTPRVAQLLRYKLGLQDDSRKSAHEFMCVDFVDRIRQILGENGAKRQENSVDETPSYSSMLVGYRGELFTVQGDFQVCQRKEPFDAVGCGADYALASLYETTGLKDCTPKKRIERALKCAEVFSAGCRGPFTVEMA